MADEHANPPQEPELFWDRVAYSGWPFDLHNPKGMRDPSHPPFTSHKTPYMFSTPLRSLVAKDVSNLFFAGRLASFSHVVYGSERVMKTCATMGQAVGTAAAYAVSQNIAPANLKDSNTSVWSIQQQVSHGERCGCLLATRMLLFFKVNAVSVRYHSCEGRDCTMVMIMIYMQCGT